MSFYYDQCSGENASLDEKENDVIGRGLRII